jgi:hypothetical protein
MNPATMTQRRWFFFSQTADSWKGKIPAADLSVIREPHLRAIWTLAHIFSGKFSLPRVEGARVNGDVAFDSNALAEIGRDIAVFAAASADQLADPPVPTDDFSNLVALSAAVFGLGFTACDVWGTGRLAFDISTKIVQSIYPDFQEEKWELLGNAFTGSVNTRLTVTIASDLGCASDEALFPEDLAALGAKKDFAVRTDADDAFIIKLLEGLAQNAARRNLDSTRGFSGHKRSLSASSIGTKEEVSKQHRSGLRYDLVRRALAAPGGGSWSSENELQKNVAVTFQVESERSKTIMINDFFFLRSFRGISEKNPAELPFHDFFHDKAVLPDALVCFVDAHGCLRRFAPIEFTSSASCPDVTSSKVRPLARQLYAIMCDNLYRKRALGILTNGTDWALVVEATRSAKKWREVKYRAVEKGVKTAANEEAVARVFDWFLDQLKKEDAEDFPKSFKVKTQNTTTTTAPTTTTNNEYVLGRFLGDGEDCAVYECLKKQESGFVVETDFVAKFYFDKKRADREAVFYEIVQKNNIANTVAPFSEQPHVESPSTSPCFMRLISPTGSFFPSAFLVEDLGVLGARSRSVDLAADSQLDPRTGESITKENVAQLTSALSALHKANVVHCDIHMDNIFCAMHQGTAQNRPAVLNDFGRSRLAEEMPLCEFLSWMQQDWKSLGNAVDLVHGENFWEAAVDEINEKNKTKKQ